ncbi:ABC transporter substrate-binding protein (plasmid) [Rhizobium leguminosarum]|nr:ABC transporter substrate-binding protein [Rhizobium leguminosarum bv. trifolii]RWX34159.1 ABC transporter substrate-binding protein [Rhizobium leguminosarum]TBF22268.1 ABC transporter substrate-binding protein [Rhizobium leguminosarum]TBF23724.1 ABC transporter substrate-binding protein [Rhizobium leguminosarum]TBF47318.1 ABC transporter substrate-binding protein [Rhizobium leguminosarum]
MIRKRMTAYLTVGVACLAMPFGAHADEMDDLVAAAKAEGQLTVIALGHDWCGYAALIQGFKDKYGLTVNELSPTAGSGEELATIKANIGNNGSQAPDVIDVGLVFGPIAQKEGLLQSYKVQTWDEIPATAKDPEGQWYGDYYGVLSFVVNKDVISKSPADWADLLGPAYRKSVSLPADPRTANNSILSVYAAGLAAGAQPGAAAARAGLEFYRQLKDSGNLVPGFGSAASIAKGETPITTRWDSNGITYAENFKGNPPLDTIVPASLTVAGVYAQAISKYAPHPHAAKLWMEYLYSDEGQLGYLKGLCHPIRIDAMRKSGKIADDMLTKLPATGNNLVFPELSHLVEAGEVIAKEWTSTVGAGSK